MDKIDKALDELEKIKHFLGTEQERVMRLKGNLDAQMVSLREMGHKTIASGKKSIISLKEKRKEVSEELILAVQGFQKEFPKLLEKV